MDRQSRESLKEGQLSPPSPPSTRITRRQAMKYIVGAAAGLSAVGGVAWHYAGGVAAASPQDGLDIFKGDAPQGELWEAWRRRGWVHEAYHYLKLGRNVQCKVCPNNCLLENGDRSHCRNKVNKDGVLYTLAYGNPCAVHVDPDREKAAFPLPARHGVVFACDGRLRVPLPELPELGHLPEQT